MQYLFNRIENNKSEMGNQSTLPESTTEFVSLDNFFSASSNSNRNIYESRLSNSSANKQLIHKSISFTESSETITRYLAM